MSRTPSNVFPRAVEFHLLDLLAHVLFRSQPMRRYGLSLWT